MKNSIFTDIKLLTPKSDNILSGARVLAQACFSLASIKLQSKRRRLHFFEYNIAIFTISVLFTTIASAENLSQKKPLWEAGVGVGALSIPAYIGSKTQREWIVPIPYFVYRSETFSADDNGVKKYFAEFYDWKIAASLSGALPVDSSDTLREGMEDIGPRLELGGELLHKTAIENSNLLFNIKFPLRIAALFNKKQVNTKGLVFRPSINLKGKTTLINSPLEWGVTLTSNFQNRHFNNIYYEVENKDINQYRSQYSSSGGYTGSSLTVGLLNKHNRWFFGTFINFNSLHHSVVENSPLVETKNNITFGFAITYIFANSGSR